MDYKLNEYERVIEELWHNLFRMHGYIEAQNATIGEDRPGILKNADRLLATSYGRVTSVLGDLRRLEPLPKCCETLE